MAQPSLVFDGLPQPLARSLGYAGLLTVLITHVRPGRAMIKIFATIWWRRSGTGRLTVGMRIVKSRNKRSGGQTPTLSRSCFD